MSYLELMIIEAVVFFAAGWVVSFFVMKNNPKYFNLKAVFLKLENMAKADLATLKAEVEKAISKAEATIVPIAKEDLAALKAELEKLLAKL
jgi:hypothetical protein